MPLKKEFSFEKLRKSNINGEEKIFILKNGSILQVQFYSSSFNINNVEYKYKKVFEGGNYKNFLVLGDLFFLDDGECVQIKKIKN